MRKLEHHLLSVTINRKYLVIIRSVPFISSTKTSIENVMFLLCNMKLLKTCVLCGCFITIIFVVSFTFGRRSISVFAMYYAGVSDAETRDIEEFFRKSTTTTSAENRTAYVMNDLTTHVLSNQLIMVLPKRICKDDKSLVVMVCSAPGNFERRRTIRETWGSDRNISNFIVDVYFMVGRTSNKTVQKRVEEEYRATDDIIQEEIVDTYTNLTAKSLMMLKVVETYCSNKTTFFMKTDDDVYVNLLLLRKVLSGCGETNLLLGHKYFRPIPKRNPDNKWYVPMDVYPAKYYPDFLSGSGYVMSTDVVQKLYRAASQIPLYFLEDVYVTGMLAMSAGVTPQNHPGFHPNKQGSDVRLYTSVITAHNYTRKEMTELHDGLKKMKCSRYGI